MPPNVQGCFVAPATIPVVPQPQTHTVRNGGRDTGNLGNQGQHHTGQNRSIGSIDMNNSRAHQGNDFSHKHSNIGRKRPQSKKLCDSKQPERLRRYSEKSVNHVEHGCSTAAVSLHEMPSRSTSGANEMPRGGPENAQPKKLYDSKHPEGLRRYSEKSVNHVEHGCSTAAVSLHEMPSRSTSGVNEMPRGGPENAQPISKENSEEATYSESDSHNPVGPLITHIEPRENLNLGCSGAAFNSKTQSSEQNVHLDNPSQQNFFTDSQPDKSSPGFGQPRSGPKLGDDHHSSLKITTVNIEGVIANKLYLEKSALKMTSCAYKTIGPGNFKKTGYKITFLNSRLWLGAMIRMTQLQILMFPRGNQGLPFYGQISLPTL